MFTVMITAVVTTMAQYIKWQFFLIGQPLYSLILWHTLIFFSIFAVFYDSRRGFNTTLRLIAKIMHRFETYRHNTSLQHRMYQYQENAKKITWKSILLPLSLTIITSFLLLSQIFFFTIITTGSMQPTLEPGDMVLMQKIKTTPNTGDILIFKVPSQPLPIVHRVYSISEHTLQTKGDANPTPDAWQITPEQIQGKAVLIAGKPLILHGVGEYFIIDARQRKVYGPEYNTIAKLLRGMKSAGVTIFAGCITLYLILSMRALRRTNRSR
jgi:signal peptidase